MRPRIPRRQALTALGGWVAVNLVLAALFVGLNLAYRAGADAVEFRGGVASFDREFDGALFGIGAYMEHPQVFEGWDLNTGATWTQNVYGSAWNGMGINERRLTLAANFTYLRNFTVGLTYVDYIGSANIAAGRLLADRDYVSLNFKYTF